MSSSRRWASSSIWCRVSRAHVAARSHAQAARGQRRDVRRRARRRPASAAVAGAGAGHSAGCRGLLRFRAFAALPRSNDDDRLRQLKRVVPELLSRPYMRLVTLLIAGSDSGALRHG